DLLKVNAEIFVKQGQAINHYAADDVRVFVVGNPCNTNALITLSHAPDIPNDRFFAMTTLDELRAKSQLAKKAGVAVSDVKKVIVWGNHSSTQYPDYHHATISAQPVTAVIKDEDWLQTTFIHT
ncbi:MAG: malate dehydrogenase, partial [Phototrophicales bacterium]